MIMSNNKYVRLTKGLNDKGILINPDSIYEHIDDPSNDWYVSAFYYNDKHLEQFKKTNTVKGITDTVTDKILFDFDNKANPDQAKTDAIELINRLKKHNIKEKDIEVYFSGNKGIHVSITVNRLLTPQQVESLAINKYGKDLATLDKSIYNPSRIIRVPGTMHQESHAYKIPLTIKELTSNTIEQIKKKAVSLDNVTDEFEWEQTQPNDEFYSVPVEVKQKIKTEAPQDLKDALRVIPKGWKDYKYALLQGFFNEGERHNALMVIAATGRALGYSKEDTYYLCKSALKKQAARTGAKEFDKEELWENIIESSVFNESWQGGQYSPKTNAWLKDYCDRLGFDYEKGDKNTTASIDDAFDIFSNYASNIDKLTIKTGIPELDKRLRMTVGMSVGLVASPGVGKTSLVLQILNNMSKSGEKAIFFSYDMYSSLVYQKLVQRVTGLDSDTIFQKFKNNDVEFVNSVKTKIKKEYENVEFCFEVGQTITDIQETINNAEERSGQKIRFIVIDYGELVITDISDPTQSSSFVAQNIRALAITNNLCSFTLYQPSKMSGTPSDPVKSYNSAKGSGAIGASVSIMLGLYRPGYNPNRPQDDIFISLVCLKNRMGSLFNQDFYWDGLRGSIRELTEEEELLLKEVREAKDKEQSGDDWS